MARIAGKKQRETVDSLMHVLKQQRLSECKSLAEKATEYDVSIETYRRWEMGKPPRLSKAKSIAAKAGLRVSDVIRWIDPSYRPPMR